MRPPRLPAVHSKNARARAMSASNEALDALASEALAYFAEDLERLSRFFAETGLSPADLRAAAGRPGFTATLLDYLATDERNFVGFATANGHDPAALDALRQKLSPPVWDP